MRILSIDHGSKRIGLAFVNTDSILLAQPVGIVSGEGETDEILARIEKFIIKYKVEKIVLGYPRNLSGNATKQTDLVEDFGDKISKILKLEVVYQDETLSSVAVSEELCEDGRGRKKRIDDQAAALILQDYIEQHIRGKI